MEYNYVDLDNIKVSIEVALKQDLNKTERFALLKNLKVCKSKLKELSDILLDDDESYLEYKSKVFQVYVDNGAKTKALQNGTQYIESFEDVDEDKVQEELEKLNDQYKEAIQSQQEIAQENLKTKQERTVDVEWFDLNFDDIKDDTNDKVLNENTLEFIK